MNCAVAADRGRHAHYVARQQLASRPCVVVAKGSSGDVADKEVVVAVAPEGVDVVGSASHELRRIARCGLLGGKSGLVPAGEEREFTDDRLRPATVLTAAEGKTVKAILPQEQEVAAQRNHLGLRRSAGL